MAQRHRGTVLTPVVSCFSRLAAVAVDRIDRKLLRLLGKIFSRHHDFRARGRRVVFGHRRARLQHTSGSPSTPTLRSQILHLQRLRELVPSCLGTWTLQALNCMLGGQGEVREPHARRWAHHNDWTAASRET